MVIRKGVRLGRSARYTAGGLLCPVATLAQSVGEPADSHALRERGYGQMRTFQTGRGITQCPQERGSERSLSTTTRQSSEISSSCRSDSETGNIKNDDEANRYLRISYREPVILFRKILWTMARQQMMARSINRRLDRIPAEDHPASAGFSANGESVRREPEPARTVPAGNRKTESCRDTSSS